MLDRFLFFYLLITGVALNGCDRRISSSDALNDAINRNDIAAIEAIPKGAAFLNAPSTVNPPRALGALPLMKAVLEGRTTIVITLLTKGADPNKGDDGGQTPIFYAWCAPGTKILEALLSEGGNVNRSDKNGSTPLMMAAGNCRVDILKLMLDNGADVSAKGPKGYTALCSAATGCPDPEMIRLLISKGADPNIRVGMERTTPLMLAAASGNADVLKALLDGNAELEARDYRGETAVFYAIGLNKAATLTALIAAGAKLNVVSDEGNQPAAEAASGGRGECLEVLRKAGIEIPPPNPAVRVSN